MPQVTEIESPDIIHNLKQRGYGIDACHGFAFRLAVRSKTDKSKVTGLGFYEPVGGITTKQLEVIKATSRDVKHAADRVESICLGRTHDPSETDDRGGGTTVKIEAILHAVDNRIEAKLDPIRESLAIIAKALGGAPIKTEAVKPAPDPDVKLQPAVFETPAPPVTDDDEEFADIFGETPPPAPEPKKRGWPKGKPRTKKAE